MQASLKNPWLRKSIENDEKIKAANAALAQLAARRAAIAAGHTFVQENDETLRAANAALAQVAARRAAIIAGRESILENAQLARERLEELAARNKKGQQARLHDILREELGNTSQVNNSLEARTHLAEAFQQALPNQESQPTLYNSQLSQPMAYNSQGSNGSNGSEPKGVSPPPLEPTVEEYEEQDQPISMTPIIINEGLTTKKYFGNVDFISSCISLMKDPTTKFIGEGAFGKTYLINNGGINYYMKSVAIDGFKFAYQEDFLYQFDSVEHEIIINIDVTNKIPNNVSNIKGAYLYKSNTLAMAYIIFEGPDGIVLSGLIKKFPPQRNREEYKRIYCMIKESQNAINSLGYVHRDIKPDNLYVVIENGRIVACKMIDFGLTKRIGEPFNSSGTPFYTPQNMVLNDDMRRNLGISRFKPKYQGKIIKRHNDYSVSVIWREDFGMGAYPTPTCAMRGGRCRRSKTRSSKKRKSKTRRI